MIWSIALISNHAHTNDAPIRQCLGCTKRCCSLKSALRDRGGFQRRMGHESASERAHCGNAGSLIDILCNDAASADHLGQTPGTIEGLVSLIQQANDYPRAVKVGIRALFSLCLADSNREPAARTGAAEALIEALVNIDKPDVSRAGNDRTSV